MKKDVKEVIQGEEAHLNNLLTTEDLSAFKGMVDELRDTWTKKQMFRTETEARFSVLQVLRRRYFLSNMAITVPFFSCS